MQIIHECNILTAVLAKAYTESPVRICTCIKECIPQQLLLLHSNICFATEITTGELKLS